MFIKPDGISLTFKTSDICEGETDTCITFAVSQQKMNLRYSRSCAILILFLLCGDIEVNPGPIEMNTLLAGRGIKICHQNIRGLFCNLEPLHKIIHDNKGIDLLALTETHIQPDSEIDNNSLYSIPGYSFIKNNRKTGLGGGVACYISEKLTFKRRKDLESKFVESLCLEITLKNSKNILISIIIALLKVHCT